MCLSPCDHTLKAQTPSDPLPEAGVPFLGLPLAQVPPFFPAPPSIPPSLPPRLPVSLPQAFLRNNASVGVNN